MRTATSVGRYSLVVVIDLKLSISNENCMSIRCDVEH